MKKRMNAFEFMDKLLDIEMAHPGTLPERLVVIGAGDLAKVATPARMELLREVESRPPRSVGELARRLGRPIEAVSKDLRILAGYGLLEMAKEGRVKRPRIEKDLLVVPLSTRGV